MGSISDQTDTTNSVEGISGSTVPNKLDLSGDEIKFLLEIGRAHV